jgi:hypothetical protein
MIREEQLVLAKLRLVVKFAGALAGGAVLTGKEVAGFGAECGKKAVNLYEAGAAAVGGIWRRAVPTKRRIADGLAEGGPGGIAPGQKAPVENPPEPIKAKGPRPRVSRAENPTYRDVTSEEIEAGAFTGAVQRVLFKRALSDLAHEDVVTRTRGAKAIGGIRNELCVRALAAHTFREEAAQVRKECINALRTLDMKEAVPVVEHALNDSSPSVRAAAVRGMYRLGGVESTSALTRMLSDENAEVRRMVATCLGWLGQEHLAVELVPLFTDEAAPVRQAAVEAVGNLGSRQVVFTLIECLNDSEESVRKKVLGVLEGITGKKLSDGYSEDEEGRQRLIARWRHWWNEESRR